MPTYNWPDERPHYAVVKRVIDGDTIVCDIDLDLKNWMHDYPVRLAGINAWDVLHASDGFTPEEIAISKVAKAAATANLTSMLPVGTKVILLTIKDYKYGGEFIARVILQEGLDLCQNLIERQWAAPYDGVGRNYEHVPVWPRTVTP